ncbi:hypothetical protein ARX36_11270 [Listeria monocytogenes]|nr:hypothetical protein [Listeria monocytogenes]EAE0835568.1 hypothetical protein [Listeria monocytogenes]EAE0958670.1 hypothetical protein [Listeria monocytogenes]EAE0974165.1 hypothetical protein [Listeria monocytogenes]EAE9677859.1 hypothetical protein [Listeria monocytogenes]
MIIANNRLKKVIDKIDFAAKNNRMMLPDKLDTETLATIYAEIEARNSKIKRLEKMAGITESEAYLIQIPNKNTDFVHCNVGTFGFDKGQQYEVVKVNKKRGTFILLDNNGKKEEFSFLAIINESFSVSKKRNDKGVSS